MTQKEVSEKTGVSTVTIYKFESVIAKSLGTFLFAEYYKRFTLQQDKHLLTLVPKKYAALPIISEIRKYCK